MTEITILILSIIISLIAGAFIAIRQSKKEKEKLNIKINELQNDKVEKSQLEKIILVEVPSKIYGDLRKTFVSLFENSGFKDVKISENVDFLNLYKMRNAQ